MQPFASRSGMRLPALLTLLTLCTACFSGFGFDQPEVTALSPYPLSITLSV